KTTRVDDNVHVLIGLFDLSMIVPYSEGKWVFVNGGDLAQMPRVGGISWHGQDR
ncbi:hypothetical protein BDR05DRAFT_890230, partial [Suillus weaverae]